MLYVVDSIQPAVVDAAADVLVSRLVIPNEAVLDDDALHMLVESRNALDVVPASCHMAVAESCPSMTPCQNVIDDARVGEDGESDTESAIVVWRAAGVLLLVEGGLYTLTARIAALVATRMDVSGEYCQQARVDPTQL